MQASTIERFAARTGMVIVRPVSPTPWSPNVSCLLANPVFLLYLREDRGKPRTWLAPTFGPIHWFPLPDVLRAQQRRWTGDWTPPFPNRSLEDHLVQVERGLDSIREGFMPAHFLKFSARVRMVHLTLGPASWGDEPMWGDPDEDDPFSDELD
jgi:hypothetical protein